MKKVNWLLILMVAMFPATVQVACKNKNKDNTQQEQKVEPAPVEITPDASLRQSVDNVLRSYPGVTADVSNGVVTLRGNIRQADLQELIRKIQELRPKKVENQISRKLKFLLLWDYRKNMTN